MTRACTAPTTVETVSIATPDPNEMGEDDCPCCWYDEPLDANPCSGAYEPAGAPSPAVVTRGDINRYAVEHAIPEALELVKASQLREVMRERDVQATERKVFHCVEVSKGVYETVTPLPYGLPPIQVHGDPIKFHWAYRCSLMRFRVARGDEARKMAGGNGCAFVVVGKGVQS